ncbi:MAG TPA: cytochrome c [Rhodothermia bacterium]|nr:cytochrome c [Rhodothermia bacterium]
MLHPRASILRWTILTAGIMPLVLVSACRNSSNTEAQIAGGRADFQAYCASCHGREAKGNGPVAEKLQTKPPDLTLLSRRFDGEFPTEYVLRTIDGRESLAAHGSRTMPVWGRIWRNEGDPGAEAEAQRILNELLQYLRSIQQGG